MATPDRDSWLHRKQAAAYLGSLGFAISPRTLGNLAANNNAGKGPPFTRFGWRTLRYRKTDLDNWVRDRATMVR